MTDLLFLILGLGLYAYLKLTSPKLQTIITGKTIIVKRRNQIINMGLCQKLDQKWAICYNASGQQFQAKVANLFWSECEQAFIERI